MKQRKKLNQIDRQYKRLIVSKAYNILKLSLIKRIVKQQVRYY